MGNTILFYDAFISYRHVEPDQTVAAELFGLLERYKTPKPLVQKGLPSHLARVFRDEDELPTSTSLSDSIKEALERSRYLIVICSEETPKSKYVAQEIEIFKALGREDKILAVLLGSDASKCFPKELLSIKDLTVVNKEKQSNFTVDIEPLAANICDTSIGRMLKKLRGREKLRLLAPILGCSFDDLYGREKKRNRKRALLSAVASIAAASLVLTALLVSHSSKIASAQGSLFNEIDQNLNKMYLIVNSMEVIFDDQVYGDLLESARAGVINGEQNTQLHDNYMITIVQGQIDSLDTLLREEQFTKEDTQLTKEVAVYFENSEEISSFYETLSEVEEKGYDLIDDCKSLQSAFGSANEENAEIHAQYLDIDLQLYYVCCERAVVEGLMAAQSAGASMDKLNELIALFNDTLQLEPISDPNQLSDWESRLQKEKVDLLLEKSRISETFSDYMNEFMDNYEENLDQIFDISEEDSIEVVRGKIKVMADYGRLEEALAGLDYFEAKFVTDENPYDQVYVDTARKFMPLEISGEIDCDGGVCLMEITEGGPFANAGIIAGDVILSYDGTAVNEAGDLIDAQKTAVKEKDEVEICYVHFLDDSSYEIITKVIPSSGTGAWMCAV